MSAPPPQAEVKIRLVLDSNAEAEAKKLSESIQHVAQESQKGTKNKFFSLDTSALKGAMSSGLVTGLMGVASAGAAVGAALMGVGAAAAHAFMESEVQVRELAGTFATLDESGAALEHIRAYASDTKDELENLGMVAGVTDDELVAVFNDVIERGGKSVDAAKALTEQMAYAGRAVPGGAATLSQAFEAIQMGMVKAKNPIVGMIASTGMLKGNAKQVAKEMSAMSPEKQMELAEKAIARMSDKMKKLPMTIEQMKTSMMVMGGNLMESMGAPIVAKLGQGMTSLRNKFFDDQGQATPLVDKLTHGAESVGMFLAKYIEMGVEVATTFYDEVSAWMPEIKAAWSDIFGDGDESFARWAAVGKVIATTLGAAVGGVATVLGYVVKYVSQMYDYVAKITKAAALWTTDKLGSTEEGGGPSANGAALNRLILGGDQDDLLKKAKMTGGGDTGAMRTQFLENARLMGQDIDAAAKSFDNAVSRRRDMENTVSDAEIASKQNNAEAFVAQYNAAAKLHDTAAQEHILQFLATNENMATAIGKMGPEILEGGKREFLDKLGAVGGKGAVEKYIEGSKLKIGGAKSPSIQMNGGQTFHIKQDFKEVDADRIAFMMNGDIMKSAIDRLQSNNVRTGSSF